MKKKLLAAAIMAALTLSASAALAAPTFSGDAQLLTQQNEGGRTFTDVRFRLNADAQLGDGIYAHGRLMGIDTQYEGSAFAGAGTGLSGAGANIEQMYLGAKVGAVDLKVGRQALFAGNGLLADVNGIEAISAGTNISGVSMDALVGRDGTTDVKGANLGTSINGVNLGASFMTKGDTDFWAANASTKVTNNVTLSADYIKNTSDDKNGFMVKATVGEVAKKGDFNYAVSYRNIEAGAVDHDYVTNGAFENSKGFRLAANYKVTDSATLSVYKDITEQQDNSSIKPNQMRAELNVNF